MRDTWNLNFNLTANEVQTYASTIRLNTVYIDSLTDSQNVCGRNFLFHTSREFCLHKTKLTFLLVF
jgi:hypothetical protein